MEKYFRRTPKGKWTSRSADEITRLSGKAMSPEQEAAHILTSMLDEGADPEWAEDVMKGVRAHDPAGRKWWPLVKRWEGDGFERWATAAIVLGNMKIGGSHWLLTREEAARLPVGDLLDLTGAMQTAAVAELVARGYSAEAAEAMEKHKWRFMRSPEKILTAAMESAPPEVREMHAGSFSASSSWLSHAADVALAFPPAPPSRLAAALHRRRDVGRAYLAAAYSDAPPFISEQCRKTPRGASCCRATAMAEARTEWASGGSKRPTKPRKFDLYAGRGELVVGDFPPDDEGWEMTRRLKEGTWEWTTWIPDLRKL